MLEVVDLHEVFGLVFGIGHVDGPEDAEGVIDLAYRAEDRWVVIDFKTDRERGEKVTHSVQLSIYARAVTAATGERVETVLLYV